jgi:hypothetical protein
MKSLYVLVAATVALGVHYAAPATCYAQDPDCPVPGSVPDGGPCWHNAVVEVGQAPKVKWRQGPNGVVFPIQFLIQIYPSQSLYSITPAQVREVLESSASAWSSIGSPYQPTIVRTDALAHARIFVNWKAPCELSCDAPAAQFYQVETYEGTPSSISGVYSEYNDQEYYWFYNTYNCMTWSGDDLVLRNTSIHEFGHILGLCGNFDTIECTSPPYCDYAMAEICAMCEDRKHIQLHEMHGICWIYNVNDRPQLKGDGQRGTMLCYDPVEMTLSATQGNGWVRLTWRCEGGVVQFTVLRGSPDGGDSVVLSVRGGAETEFTDDDAEPGSSYVYEVRAVLLDGSEISQNVSLTVPLAVNAVYQPRPNPALVEIAPHGVVQFSMATPGEVTAEIYDAHGRVVRNDNLGFQRSGIHDFTWDWRTGGGALVSSGVYFVRVELDGVPLGQGRLVVIR